MIGEGLRSLLFETHQLSHPAAIAIEVSAKRKYPLKERPKYFTLSKSDDVATEFLQDCEGVLLSPLKKTFTILNILKAVCMCVPREGIGVVADGGS